MAAEPSNLANHEATHDGQETPTTGQNSKAVTIFDEPEHIPHDASHATSPQHTTTRLHRANISGRKLSGRPPINPLPSSPSLSRNMSQLKLEEVASPEPSTPGEQSSLGRDDGRKLLAQVQEWLNQEKSKRSSRQNGSPEIGPHDLPPSASASRVDLEPDLALDQLEKILHGFSSGALLSQQPDLRPRKSYSAMNLRRGSIAKAFKRSTIAAASSDTEWAGEDVNVPHVEASLDNSKTMAFTTEATESQDVEEQQRDTKHWDQFKQEIVRLTHTLKIRGWRRIPIEKGEVISVERLSGALTNAVYVVKPPKDLPDSDESSNTKAYVSKSRPKELLLRIYGPQVEHLIDRESELDILRRLARKRIGPRLLGYFTNGRFEEYLHAKTLTAEDIRVPATMKQIAKRMRELHDGVDLLSKERRTGASTFVNWDKWVDRCETVITWLDAQVKLEADGQPSASPRYTRRGLVCGVEWPVFRKAYETYRKQLVDGYGGIKAIRNRLIFAHNDAQYGNLMKLDPPGGSPLLESANSHRQLVVIDFEYAGANTAGFEFANHFSEWCYNYHHAEKSYACNTNYYPTEDEQRKFIHAYVMHRPQFNPSASSTPKMEGREKTNISDFMLDARTPLESPALDYDGQEKERAKSVEKDIRALMDETRLWRIANAAQWVAWGIVQAKVPELDDPPKKSKAARLSAALGKVREHIYPKSDPLDEDVKQLHEAAKHDRPEGREQEEAHLEGDHGDGDSEEDEEVEEFDYLAYSQERAMFFWGDCLQQGIVKKEDLPEALLKQIKIVEY